MLQVSGYKLLMAKKVSSTWRFGQNVADPPHSLGISWNQHICKPPPQALARRSHPAGSSTRAQSFSVGLPSIVFMTSVKSPLDIEKLRGRDTLPRRASCTMTQLPASSGSGSTCSPLSSYLKTKTYPSPALPSSTERSGAKQSCGRGTDMRAASSNTCRERANPPP